MTRHCRPTIRHGDPTAVKGIAWKRKNSLLRVYVFSFVVVKYNIPFAILCRLSGHSGGAPDVGWYTECRMSNIWMDSFECRPSVSARVSGPLHIGQCHDLVTPCNLWPAGSTRGQLQPTNIDNKCWQLPVGVRVSVSHLICTHLRFVHSTWTKLI